jgi:hypothetical protein
VVANILVMGGEEMVTHRHVAKFDDIRSNRRSVPWRLVAGDPLRHRVPTQSGPSVATGQPDLVGCLGCQVDNAQLG